MMWRWFGAILWLWRGVVSRAAAIDGLPLPPLVKSVPAL